MYTIVKILVQTSPLYCFDNNGNKIYNIDYIISTLSLLDGNFFIRMANDILKEERVNYSNLN